MEEDRDLLIVGPVHTTGGGITELVEEHANQFSEKMSVSMHDVGTRDSALLTILLSVFKLATFPTRSRPNVVHIHCSGRLDKYRACFYALLSAYLLRCPAIFHLNGSKFNKPDSRLLHMFLRFSFDSLDRFIVVSEYWKDQVEPYVASNKLVVLPNPINTNLFQPNFEPSEEYERQFQTCATQIVFMATFIPRKGVSEFVQAIDQIQQQFGESEFCVSICGDGPLKPEVEVIAEEYANVEYLGFVTGEEKLDVLANSSIYVLPTHSEGLPVGLLEAYATGNAVITTPVTSIPEVFNDEINGWFVEPGDKNELVAALATAINSPEIVSEMSAVNRETAVANYAWPQIVEQLETLYANV